MGFFLSAIMMEMDQLVSTSIRLIFLYLYLFHLEAILLLPVKCEE